jgi:crotonobetainyl-CoA:carnitine CoA-transferase CaiB-like acyl-CoA transferase
MRRGSFFVAPRPEPLDTLKMRLVFECKDGFVCLTLQGGSIQAAVNSGKAIVAWANEEGYALPLAGHNWREWNSATLMQSEQERVEDQLTPFLLTKTKSELLREATERRILLAPVSTASDVAGNPQFAAREFWQNVPHPELEDTIVYPGPSVKVDQSPQRIRRRAPTIGEHNQEIYGGELELSGAELDSLGKAGVI